MELSQAWYAGENARRCRELAGSLQALTMNFVRLSGKNPEITSVPSDAPDLEAKLEKAFGKEWIPAGFVGTERGAEMTIVHTIAWPNFAASEQRTRLQDQVLERLKIRLMEKLGLSPVGGEA
jgi:hypothetical protein